MTKLVEQTPYVEIELLAKVKEEIAKLRFRVAYLENRLSVIRNEEENSDPDIMVLIDTRLDELKKLIEFIEHPFCKHGE